MSDDPPIMLELFCDLSIDLYLSSTEYYGLETEFY